MPKVVWINSSSFPFLELICRGWKPFETRSRNMLGGLVGERVILAESSRGQRLARCSAVIKSVREVRTREDWDALRPLHRVPAGNKYDWKDDTKVKYLYELSRIRLLVPFRIPSGTSHGRTWMEYETEE